MSIKFNLVFRFGSKTKKSPSVQNGNTSQPMASFQSLPLGISIGDIARDVKIALYIFCFPQWAIFCRAKKYTKFRHFGK